VDPSPSASCRAEALRADPLRRVAQLDEDRRHGLDERGRPADEDDSCGVGRAWAEFVTRSPARRRLPTGEISLSGEPDRVAELIETFAAAGAR
jgi:alkanesulfonate monooxygenase SsuD/methylene tetrahydromethanopterin reductase-like flavin-dependent oxidoreductase (luciferase family)